MRTLRTAVTFLWLSAGVGWTPSVHAADYQEAYYPWKEVQVLSDGWKYIERNDSEIPLLEDQEAKEVQLPHTWNALDTQETREYRRDASWYLRTIEFDGHDKKRRHFVRITGAGQTADVYLNGNHLGNHIGGYTAFTFELTPHIQDGDNTLAVRVSNAPTETVAPLAGDFNMYGGLYRSVQILSAKTIHFTRTDRGGPGVRVWSPRVSETSATVHVATKVDNGDKDQRLVEIVANLYDPEGELVSQSEEKIWLGGASVVNAEFALPTVENPTLWTPDEPTLYRLVLQLFRDGELLDETTVHHGFRWFRFDPNEGFFLNGKHLRLRGVNRHQDYPLLGNALPPSQHIRDLEYMKEMGVNWFRLAHYPQDDLVLELCDRMGFLVWEEIPWVKDTTYNETFDANCESQLLDMITQHFNHPSVILWGLNNELMLGGVEHSKMVPLIERLNAVAHKEDPIRKTVLACHKSDNYTKFGLTAIPDVVGYNLYYGWYYNAMEDLTAGLEGFHEKHPDKPLIVSEYGPGSELGRHSAYPGPFDFTEDYQVAYHESYLDQFEKIPFLSGVTVWNMFDFGSANRGDSIPHVNQKGLMTFDRKKKDAFYSYKARWSDEPVAYLLSPSWTERSGKAKKEYRVISNCESVELFHRKESLGRQTSGFRWVICLSNGSNAIKAVGKKGSRTVESEIDVHYDPSPPLPKGSIRINCGGEEYKDTNGNLWWADRAFVDAEGAWGAIGGQVAYQEETKVSGVEETDLFRHYRAGPQGYFFDLPEGKYRVRLGLFAPPSPLESDLAVVADISLQGTVVEQGWKYLKRADSRRAVWKEYETSVQDDEGLIIRFLNKERHNDAALAALEIIPH